MDHQRATETSPLLAKPTTTLSDLSITSNTIPPSNIEATAHQDADSKSVEDEESRSNSKDRLHQYQGMPDVKAKLRYIVPAVGIGVMIVHHCLTPLLTLFRYSFPLRTRPLSYPAMEKSVVISNRWRIPHGSLRRECLPTHYC